MAAQTACCWRHLPSFCWHMAVAHMLQKSASAMCERVYMTVCVCVCETWFLHTQFAEFQFSVLLVMPVQ